MAKRQILAEGGDPTKTTIPLDLLEMRGIISMSQSEVGRVYGWLRRMIYGRTDVRAFDLNHVAGRDTQAELLDWERLEKRYDELADALTSRGRDVRRATDDACVFVNGGAKLVHPGGAKLVHLMLCGTRCWGVGPVVHRRDPRCFV